jgi:hypothetical protein
VTGGDGNEHRCAPVPTFKPPIPPAVPTPAAAIPPHDFKTPQPASPVKRLPQPSCLSKAGNSDSNPARRKPPETVKPAPKERKITAPAARRR